MADKSYTWQVSSPYIDNGPGVISSAYNVNNKSPFTTITTDNPLGYVKVFPNSNSTDLNIKNLEYAVRADGVITYRVQDGTNNPRQYNSLQQLADGRGGWSGATTDQVKIQMNGILSTTAQSKGITPSQPTPQEQGDNQGGAQSLPTTETLTTLAKGIEGRPPRSTYDNLRYPKDLKESDSIQFTMFSYGTKTYDDSAFGFGKRDFDKIKISGSVTMSIQPSITDLNYVRWSPSEMGPLATAAADSSLTLIEEGAEGLGTIERKIAGTLGREGESIAKAIIASAAGQASGSKGLLTRITGAMFNNNLELLFQGPELRQFTFTFKLSPRYKEEADDVKKIIRFFKQGGAVQRTNSNLFLKSPNIFRIKYLNSNDENHKSLNRIKECALVSCGVDYTPIGSYMTFNDEDATMVSYTLSLTFNELEPVYEDEYRDLDGETNDSAGIGY